MVQGAACFDGSGKLNVPRGATGWGRALVGSQKEKLDPGASQSVTIEIGQNDSSHPMSYWDTTANAWKVASGTYTVHLGNSSAVANLVAAGTITIQ